MENIGKKYSTKEEMELILEYKIGDFIKIRGPYYIPRKYRNFCESYIGATKIEYKEGSSFDVILECDECFSIIGKLECSLSDGLDITVVEIPEEDKKIKFVRCSCGRIINRTDKMLCEVPDGWFMW